MKRQVVDWEARGTKEGQTAQDIVRMLTFTLREMGSMAGCRSNGCGHSSNGLRPGSLSLMILQRVRENGGGVRWRDHEGRETAN